MGAYGTCYPSCISRTYSAVEYRATAGSGEGGRAATAYH